MELDNLNVNALDLYSKELTELPDLSIYPNLQIFKNYIF